MQLKKVLAVSAVAMACLTGCQKTVDDIAGQIVLGVVSSIGDAIECSISSSFASSDSRIPLEIEQADFERLIKVVKSKKITSNKGFWKKIDKEDAQKLRQWISAGYDRIPTDNILRSKPVKFYEGIFSYGMMEVSKRKTQAGTYDFARSHEVRDKKAASTHWEHYILAVKVTGSPSKERDYVQLCVSK